MFESLLPYRKEVALDLIQQISAKTLPHALLFSGVPFSGRLSLALETARIVSCANDGALHCSCASCRSFARYAMHNVVFVGSRNHKIRIESALTNFTELRTKESQRQLLGALRMMLLQFHSALLDSSTQRQGAAFDAAAEIDETLFALEEASSDEFPAYAEKLQSLLKPLLTTTNRATSLTIGQVRSLQEWTLHTSFEHRPRWIILEGVEHSTVGTRNSLLKLLEEPPKQTFIVLISEHPTRLLPTILSRVQHFHIRPFSEDEKNRLLAEVFFADGSTYTSLYHYILERSGIPCQRLTKQAQEFLERIGSHVVLSHKELSALCEEFDEQVSLEYFFDEFLTAVRQKYLQGEFTAKESSRLAKIVGEAKGKATLFNQNKKLLVESLHYRLQEEL